LNSRRTEGPDRDRISREITSAKWLVWHGKGRKALPRLQAVNEELEKWPNQEHTALWWNVHKVYCYIRSHTRFPVNRGALPEGITHQQQHRRVGGQPSRERKDG
jgi:hypothetical protein